MNKYLRWLRLAMPFIHLATSELSGVKNAKAQKTIKAIQYVDRVLSALVNGEEIPDAPAELTTSEK